MSDDNRDRKEISIIYWQGVFVPVVVSVLVLTSIAVLLTTNVGEPHALLKRKMFGGVLPKGFRSIR
jgi:hypothetical protein